MQEVPWISSILKNVSLGVFFFKTAIILRESLFINGILTNSECWNFLSQKQIKIFEDADARLFSSFFCSPRSTNRVLYYLETGKIPLRHVLAKRRLMYLWHVLSRPNQELISRVFSVMKLKPVKNDWCKMIEDEKNKYNIVLEDEEIKGLSRNKFKALVEDRVNKFAFKSLMSTARKQSKCKAIVQDLDESDIKIQKYLICDKLMKDD